MNGLHYKKLCSPRKNYIKQQADNKSKEVSYVKFTNKRGAMDVGVGTIVILVIAMVVIGAMVMFINNFIIEGEKSLNEALDSASELGLDVSASEPLAYESLTVQSGGQTTLQAGVYNSDDSPAQNVTIDIRECARPSAENELDTENPDIFTLAQTIEATDDVGYRLSLSGKNASGSPLPADTYVCNIVAETHGNDPDIDGEVIAEDQIEIDVTG